MANAKSSLFLRLGLVAGVLIAAAFGAFYLLRPVARVQTIGGGTAVNAVPGSVVVRAERDEEVKAEVGGRMLKSDMDDGKFFKKGDFLAQLDTADLLLEIEKIETDLEATRKKVEVDKGAEYELENSKGAFENTKRLHTQGLISDYEYQKQNRALQSMEQKLEISRVLNKQTIDNLDNGLRTKKRQLEKMTIRAPFDCVVSRAFARENALVSNGAAIASLISVNRTVEAKVSEENFSGIRVGQKAVVRFLGYGGMFDAKVSRLLPTADPETQRYIVHLEVDIDPVRLVPGITGEANIVLAEREAKTLVPRRALWGHNVYVVKNGTVSARHIELGYVSLNIVEVTKGLEPGEQVIIEDVDSFHDGQSVRIDSSK